MKLSIPKQGFVQQLRPYMIVIRHIYNMRPQCTFGLEFPETQVRNLKAIIDGVCLGIPEWCIMRYCLTCLIWYHWALLVLNILRCFRVFFLDVPNDIVLERLTLRATDPISGERYHMLYNPPRTQQIKDRLTQNPRDSEEEVIKDWLKLSEQKLDYFLFSWSCQLNYPDSMPSLLTHWKNDVKSGNEQGTSWQ